MLLFLAIGLIRLWKLLEKMLLFFSYWTYKTMEITRKDVVFFLAIGLIRLWKLLEKMLLFFSYWTYKTMEIVRKKNDFFLHAILKLYCAYLLVVAKLSFCLYAFLEYSTI